MCYKDQFVPFVTTVAPSFQRARTAVDQHMPRWAAPTPYNTGCLIPDSAKRIVASLYDLLPTVSWNGSKPYSITRACMMVAVPMPERLPSHDSTIKFGANIAMDVSDDMLEFGSLLHIVLYPPNSNTLGLHNRPQEVVIRATASNVVKIGKYTAVLRNVEADSQL